MATKKATAFDFCHAYLKKKPKATFAEVRDAAKKKRLVLYPISYGRTKALLGLVPTAKYGKSKAKKKSGRGPGRPKGSKNKVKKKLGRPKGSKNKPRGGSARATADLDSLNGLISMIKNLERERDDALRTIEKIRALL